PTAGRPRGDPGPTGPAHRSCGACRPVPGKGRRARATASSAWPLLVERRQHVSQRVPIKPRSHTHYLALPHHDLDGHAWLGYDLDGNERGDWVRWLCRAPITPREFLAPGVETRLGQTVLGTISAHREPALPPPRQGLPPELFFATIALRV